MFQLMTLIKKTDGKKMSGPFRKVRQQFWNNKISEYTCKYLNSFFFCLFKFVLRMSICRLSLLIEERL